MAGIAFELRKILKRKTLSSIFAAFGYSFALSSGPYVITIISLILINFIASYLVSDSVQITQFQVTVTYIIAFSLILNGLTNLYLIRFLADMIFVKKYDAVIPNLIGAIILNAGVGFILSLTFSLLTLPPYTSYSFVFLFTLCFTIFMCIWTLNTILTGFKSYKYILFSYAISYTIFLILSLLFIKSGLTGMLLAFTISNSILFFMFFAYTLKNYYSDRLLSFDFLKENKYKSLMLTGFFYNFAIWTDKLVFWFHPYTNTQVLGPLSYSVVYDIPVFLAYLSIAPGISAMFLKVEWEFAEYYDKYYNAARDGALLDKIYIYGDELISSARGVLLDTFRIQAIFSVFITTLQEPLFSIFKLPKVYIPLFDILLLGTSLQVVLFSLIALMFYFDRLKYALITTFVYAISNLSLSLLSIYLGPYFYGYGFAISVMLSIVVGIILMRSFLNDIHYYTFMHI